MINKVVAHVPIFQVSALTLNVQNKHAAANMFSFDKLNFTSGARLRWLIVVRVEGFKPPYVSRMVKRLLALKQAAGKRYKCIISQVLLATYC